MGVTGSARLRYVAKLVRDSGDKDLPKELRRGINKPVAPFRAAVKAETATLPSGYAPVLGGALRVNTSIKTKGVGAGITVVVFAKGKKEDRDVAAVNAGTLRHKTYGRAQSRSGKSLWFAQGVPRGFVSRPAERMIVGIAREVAAACDRVAAKITGG